MALPAHSVTLLLLLAALVAPPSAAVDYEARTWQLDAGTEVVLVEDHRVGLVHVVIEFPVGNWSPWTRDNHAEEAFDIQMYDPDRTFRARADRLSAGLHASMDPHESTLFVECLREDVESVLDLVRDVLANRDFDRSELRRWNRSDRLAWSASRKEPQFRLSQESARLLYSPSDPRREAYEKPRPRITRVERLAAARDVIVRLPGRVIGFAGDVTRAEAERWAAGLLPVAAEAPPGGLEPELGPLRPMDELPSEHVVTMPRIEQAFFGYGRHSLTFESPRYPAFMVVDNVLGGHFFSRMYQALRHEGGETYGAGTRGKGGVYAEGYALFTFTRGDNAAATEEKLRAVLRRLHDNGITEQERQAAVGYLSGRRPFSRQAPLQVLQRLLLERRHDLPPGYLDELVDRAARVPLAEINAFVRGFYDPERFAMIKVVPR